MKRSISAALAGTSLAALTAVLATSASAGGFAIREQSVESQGASFAGSAAFGGLSSMYWNPAAAANKDGMNFDSNYTVILPKADIHVKGGTAFVAGGQNDSGNIGSNALVPASYANYQFANYDRNLYLGLALNSPFGLVTEPDNSKYTGAVLGRTSKLFTLNVNPNLAYRLSPSLTVGAGVQMMYANGTFKFATGTGAGPSTGFEGTGVAFGATAGLMYTPTSATTIGLGYRSRMTEKLEGEFYTNASALTRGVALSTAANAEIKLPDIVTLSLKQAVSSNTRLLGTVEWSNWSRFDELRVKSSTGGTTILGTPPAGGTIAVIDAKWTDGWFFSLGGEYDVNQKLTLRTGVAYELSPVDDAKKRIAGIPDSDRIWASLGASYKWSDTTSFDLAYTHIFLKDAEINRTSLSRTTVFADTTASTDIISVGMKMKFGGSEPLK
jgi:long-chain fatty acid transport protein